MTVTFLSIRTTDVNLPHTADTLGSNLDIFSYQICRSHITSSGLLQMSGGLDATAHLTFGL